MSPRNPLIIQWAEAAAKDMDGIADYLFGEGLAFDAVEDYVKHIYNAPHHLTTLPGAGKPGRVVPSIREWLIEDTPYAFLYRVLANRVQILRVMHGSRQFSEQ